MATTRAEKVFSWEELQEWSRGRFHPETLRSNKIAAMTIDPQAGIGLLIPEQQCHWDESDTQRYRRAIGQSAGMRGVLPTFAMTFPGAFGVASPEFHGPRKPEIRFPGIRLDLATLLHQEQELVVHHQVPEIGRADCRGRVVAVEGRGTAAVLVQRSTVADDSGTVLATSTSRIHARGENIAGLLPPGPATAPVVPDRLPDREIPLPTEADQAVLYQRCGRGHSMYNNVHTDAGFARGAGFAGPILQGACTYGMVCALLVEAVLDSDIARIRRYSARFTGIVFPGESLRIRVWSTAGSYLFVTSVPDRDDKPVLAGVLDSW